MVSSISKNLLSQLEGISLSGYLDTNIERIQTSQTKISKDRPDSGCRVQG